jgi:hypothetical protein
MDQYQLTVAFAAPHLAELRRQADRRRLASRVPGPTAGQHHHEPGVFDTGYCWACARQAGLLDHHRRVQQEEASLQETWEWACTARRFAILALGSSGAAILLAAIALLTG